MDQGPNFEMPTPLCRRVTGFPRMPLSRHFIFLFSSRRLRLEASFRWNGWIEAFIIIVLLLFLLSFMMMMPKSLTINIWRLSQLIGIQYALAKKMTRDELDDGWTCHSDSSIVHGIIRKKKFGGKERPMTQALKPTRL